jgi:hypothetical protein
MSNHGVWSLNRIEHQFAFPVDVHTIVYCVPENGNKFIQGEPVDSNRSLTVVPNWTARRKHGILSFL